MNRIMLAAIAGMFGGGARTMTDGIRSIYRANGWSVGRPRKSPSKLRSWSIIRDRATGEFRFRRNGARQGTRPGHRAARKGGAR